MTYRDRRLQRDRVIRICGLGLLAVAFVLPARLGWPWSAGDGATPEIPSAEASIRHIRRGFREGIVGWELWSAPLLLLPAWITAMTFARSSRAARLGAVTTGVAASALIATICLSGVGTGTTTVPGVMAPFAVPYAIPVWVCVAVVACVPRRRRTRSDPLPLASAQALACAIPWVLLSGMALDGHGTFEDYGCTSSGDLMEDELPPWHGAWPNPPIDLAGTYLTAVGLLLFALPTYLPRRTAHDAVRLRIAASAEARRRRRIGA